MLFRPQTFFIFSKNWACFRQFVEEPLQTLPRCTRETERVPKMLYCFACLVVFFGLFCVVAWFACIIKHVCAAGVYARRLLLIVVLFA